MPNSPSRWKVSPIQLDFSAFVIEILHRQIILRYSRTDCVFIRLLFNSEHTKLPSMHLSHHDQISYCTNYTILKKNLTFFIQTMILMHLIPGYPKYLKNRPGPKCETVPCPLKNLRLNLKSQISPFYLKFDPFGVQQTTLNMIYWPHEVNRASLTPTP